MSKKELDLVCKLITETTWNSNEIADIILTIFRNTTIFLDFLVKLVIAVIDELPSKILIARIKDKTDPQEFDSMIASFMRKDQSGNLHHLGESSIDIC